MLKRMAALTVVACALVLTSVNTATAQPRMSVKVTFSELDAHGEWYKLPKVGWVWAPYADEDWRPFTYGYWSWTSDGWMWSSYEPFGWITCHYGNWYYDDNYGWLWVPGYTWSPARVNWVVTDYDIRWAPMPPPGFRRVPAFAPNARSRWVVVPTRYFTSDNVYEHRVQVQTSVKQPKPRVLYKAQPKVKYITKQTKRKIVPVKVKRGHQVAGNRKLVKVQVTGRPAPRPNKVVPVGVKYKGVRPRPGGNAVGLQKGAPQGKALGHQKTGPQGKALGHQKTGPQGKALGHQKGAPHGKAVGHDNAPGQNKGQGQGPAAKKKQESSDPRVNALLKEKQSKETAEKKDEESELETRSRNKENSKAKKQ